MTQDERQFTVDRDGGPADAVPPGRLPLEHALALDAVCASLSPGDTVSVLTQSPRLLQGVVNRHDRLVVPAGLREAILVPDHVTIVSSENVEGVDRVLVLEPTAVEPIERVTERRPGVLHDCLVGNPFSYNRVADRAVHGWLSPLRAWWAYRSAGFQMTLRGYHGPRSLVQSLQGRLRAAQPAARDRYTQRMQDAYRETVLPLVLGSCLVHIQADMETT